MPEAQYTVLLAQAVPSLTLHEIEWGISLAKGWSLIHAYRLLKGQHMVWADRNLSARGQWWNKVMTWFKQRRQPRN